MNASPTGKLAPRASIIPLSGLTVHPGGGTTDRMGENSPLSGTRGPVATAIRLELVRREMSANELARRVGIKRAAFGRRMTGQVPFTVDDLTRIAAELDVPVTALLPVDEKAA